MPLHDWTRVPDGIYHGFHAGWIIAISDALNAGRLPADYYSLPEQITGPAGPDVLALQMRNPSDLTGGGRTAVLPRPSTAYLTETEAQIYRRRKRQVTVRHVSDDRVVAIIEVLSPGNKDGEESFDDFVAKACILLERRIHLLLVDPLPRTRRDPDGIHAVIWAEATAEEIAVPAEPPFTLVSYECGPTTRAYYELVDVGSPLPDMPLFLEPSDHVRVPLEECYQTVYGRFPKRWRDVLEASPE